MSSRIRSATTAPGAVTEQDFLKYFKEIKPVQINTTKELADTLEEITKVLINPNGDWKKKTTFLAKLRGILVSDFPNILNLMVEHSSLWEQGLINGMKELRSSLCKEYCVTVAFFAEKLGSRFFRQVNLFFDGLISLVQNSAKIMASAAYIATEFVAKYVQHPKLISIIAGYLSSKSVAIRRDVVHLAEVILTTWNSEFLESQNLVKILMEIVKSSCCDADIQCRQIGREAYFILAEKYPEPARIVYESLDPQRQKMINDTRSAASSSRSIVHERGDLPMINNLKAQRNQFLATRSRSDLNFRPNSKITPSRNLAPTSKDTDSNGLLRSTGITPNVRKDHLFAKPSTVQRPTSAVRKPPPAKPKIAAPSSAPSNGTSTITARTFGVFGPNKNNTVLTNDSKMSLKATPVKTFTKPNIRPPTITQRNVRNSIETSPTDRPTAMTPDENRPLLVDICEEMKNGLQRIKDNPDIAESLSHSLVDILNKFKEYMNDGKLLPENIDDEGMNEYFNKFKSILVILVMIFRDSTFPSSLRVTSLECVKKVIDEHPSIIGDKLEFLIMRLLECQDRSDLLLCRAAETCGVSVVKHFSVEKCKELVMPLIVGENARPDIVAAALKLLSQKYETIDGNTVESILLETKNTVVNLYTHPEAVVRRGAVIYFVSIASILGIERLRPHLPAQMMRMVAVYYEKIMKNSELGL